MTDSRNETCHAPRLLKLAGISVVVALALLAPYLSWYVVEKTRGWISGFVSIKTMQALLRARLFIFVAIASIPLTILPERTTRIASLRDFWDRLETIAEWCASAAAPWILGVACSLVAATWLPHYLTWPWWADTDYFAVAALSWDSGILPYRDLYDFNFPGPIYAHWFLGKMFGWGRTWPAYALDAGLLFALGWALVLWSRARLGGTVPGWAAFTTWLVFYAGRNYAITAQRDWQATALAVISILILETRRDRLGLVGSAVAFAAALSIRPHPVVLAPALLSALDEFARPEGGSPRKTARAALAWGAVAAAGLFLAAAPLVIAGVADDFVRWFRVAWFGGGYHRGGSRDLALVVRSQIESWPYLLVFGLLLIESLVGFVGQRRVARTWLLALAFVVLYKPLSPVMHDYLSLPPTLVWCVALGAAATGFARPSRIRPTVRLLVVAALLVEAIPGIPANCRIRASLAAIGDLAAGRPPSVPPPGAESHFREIVAESPVFWSEYQGALVYLRTKVGPGTRVANFLNFQPFPTLNGPTARLPLFPSPGGFLWLRAAAPEMTREFADVLERAEDAVVVWRPGPNFKDERPRIPEISEAIARHYEFEARSGRIEIWRRKPARLETNPEAAPLSTPEGGHAAR